MDTRLFFFGYGRTFSPWLSPFLYPPGISCFPAFRGMCAYMDMAPRRSVPSPIESKGCSCVLYPASTTVASTGSPATVSFHVVMQPIAGGHLSGESIARPSSSVSRAPGRPFFFFLLREGLQADSSR
jgi:hypothetical protein